MFHTWFIPKDCGCCWWISVVSEDDVQIKDEVYDLRLEIPLDEASYSEIIS